MGDYASKGVGTAGLTTGIIGTSLAGLLTLGSHSSLFGGSKTDELQSEIAELKAEKYANNVGIEVYKASAERDAKQNSRFEELAREIADIRVREAQTQGQIATNQAITNGQIAQVSNLATNGINVLTTALGSLQNTVSQITKTVVPKDACCPEYMLRYNSWTTPSNSTSESN